MKPKLKLILSALLLVIFSCSKEEQENNCIENKTAYVTSINSPSTGIVNENINIEVSFGVNNGCGNFGKFIETGSGNTKIIEVEARYEGCVCTMDAPTRKINYVFKTQNSGNYIFKFKSSSTEHITVNLAIN
jgi:hypothetical protein